MQQTLSEALQYLSPAIAFAAMLLAALVLFGFYYCRHIPQGLALSPDGERPRFSFTAPLTPMTRQDWKLCVVITLVYALSAFFMLGSFSAPQSKQEFARVGTVEISLPETAYLASMDYFPGLGTGSYRIEISEDGQAWLTLWPRKDEAGKIEGYYWANAEGYAPNYALEQTVPSLFKWKSITFDNPQYARYLRITPKLQRDVLQLCEIGFRDHMGTILDLTCPSPLFDEQELIPEKSTWFNSTYFDEIYHSRTALEHLENAKPYETTHPPLGKIFQGIGISLFGMTPFGWRFIGTLLGVLMLPILYVFLKNFFGRSLIALCGTMLMATDFMHLTQTRIATIDTYAVFFILAAYFFLYRWIALPQHATVKQGVLPLFLSGLMFGIGAACKWTVFYAAAGMALLYLFNLIFRYRNRQEDGPKFWPWAWKTILLSVVFFVIIPLCIYTLSYYPYAKQRGDTSLGSLVQIMWDNQVHMLTYHQGVTEPHPYASKWWMWLLDAKPILYYMENTASTSTRFAAFLNPLLCWGGLLALFFVGHALWKRRDGKALFILVGYLAQLAPWIPIARPTFNYHYFPAVPFLVFALCYLFNDLARVRPHRWKGWVLGLTGTAAGLYIAFYPVLIGLTIPRWYSTALRWLPGWPF